MGFFDDAFEFLFDDVLGIIDVPTAPKIEQPSIDVLNPLEEAQKTQKLIERQKRKTGGLSGSLIG